MIADKRSIARTREGRDVPAADMGPATKSAATNRREKRCSRNCCCCCAYVFLWPFIPGVYSFMASTTYTIYTFICTQYNICGGMSDECIVHHFAYCWYELWIVLAWRQRGKDYKNNFKVLVTSNKHFLVSEKWWINWKLKQRKTNTGMLAPEQH